MNPELWGLELSAFGILVAVIAIALAKRLERTGRCGRCFRKVAQYRYDMPSNQLVCPHCNAAVARFIRLPLMEGRVVRPREYRFSIVLRSLFFVLAIGAFFGPVLFAFILSKELQGHPITWLVFAAVFAGLGIWMLQCYSVRFTVTEDGITARSVLGEKRLKWTDVQRIVKVSGGDDGMFYNIHSTRERRAWPRLCISDSIQGVEELVAIIVAKADLTDTSKRGFFSTEIYERLSPEERLLATARPH